MKQIISLLLGTLPLAAAAQTPTDTATTYRHQLGLTASPQLNKFFTANRSLPLGLLYQRQVKPNQAVRARLVGQYSRRDTADFAGSLPGSSNRYWELNGYVGYEWQQQLGRHTSLYYGAEVGTGISQRSFHDVRSGQDTNGDYQYDALRTSKQWRVEVRPFLGISVAVSQRVHLFAESVVSTSYTRRRDDYNGTGTRTYPNGLTVPTGVVTAYVNSDVWQVRWRPVQLMGLSFGL